MPSSVLRIILDFAVTSEDSSVFHTFLTETTGKQKNIIFLRLLDPENEVTTILPKVGIFSQNDTLSHPRRLASSPTPL
jgi:hypothetical protein